MYASIHNGIFNITDDETGDSFEVKLADASYIDLFEASVRLGAFLTKHDSSDGFMCSSTVHFPEEYGVTKDELEALLAPLGLA